MRRLLTWLTFPFEFAFCAVLTVCYMVAMGAHELIEDEVRRVKRWWARRSSK